MADTKLPAGVQTVEAANPAPPAAAPSPAPVMESGGAVKSWNWLHIGLGVVIVTVACFSIYYFRYRTRQYADSIVQQNEEISALQAKVDELEKEVHPN